MAEHDIVIIPGMETARRPTGMSVDVKGDLVVDKDFFYSTIRPSGLFPHLTQSQVNGMNAVLDEWDARQLTDLRWLAYMLATAYHETGTKMQAIEEWGKGSGRPYGKKIKHTGVKYVLPNVLFYGRGLVQLTWYENYELMGRLLGIDLLNHPEKALQLDIAVKIMFEGMLKGASSFGDFTGRCLEMYFNPTTEKWTEARKIINGLDKATLIAGYGKQFIGALKVV